MPQILKPTCLALVLCFIFSACSGGEDADIKSERQVFAMDTLMQLSAYGAKAEKALDLAEDELLRLEALFDPELETSEVYRLNNGETVYISSEISKVLELCYSVYSTSGGMLNPLLYPIIKAWGFIDYEYSVPSDDDIAALLDNVTFSSVDITNDALTLPSGVQLTFGAVAKGYASQSVIDIFAKNGVTSAIVSLGGNVQSLGLKPDGSNWNVAVIDPEATNTSLGTLSIGETAVVTSGGYQRYFEDSGEIYHHIIDPRTGYPSDSGLLSATIVCVDGALADALSTAMFVLGETGTLAYYNEFGGFEYILVTQDGRVLISKGLTDSFTPSEGKSYEYVNLS